MAKPAMKAALTDEDLKILADFPTHSYEQLREKYGWSRGRIYSLVTRLGMRKTEMRIQERRAERAARQREQLEQMLENTTSADVLDYMDSLPDGCAQMVLTSVPYNVGKKYGDCPSADALCHVYYLGWMMQILSEAARILADGGILFLQVGATRDETDTLIPLDILLFDAIKRTGLTFQNRIAWTIAHGLTPKRRLAERYETVLVFAKGEPATFNPTPGRTPQKQPGKRAFKGPNKGTLSGHPLGAWPTNVWKIPNVGHNHPEKTGHPAQFPLELAKRAILIYTNPGDLVVDPFSGSGTTQAACREAHRSFSGCDLFYQDLRERRLAAVAPDDVCPLPGVSDESVAVWQAEAVRVDIPANDTQLTLV